MSISEHTELMVSQQNESRKNWLEHDNASTLDAFILEEGREMREEVPKAELGDDPFGLASEIGDVIYLWTKRKKFKEPVPVDVMETVLDAFELCRQTGLEPDDCVKMKTFRNDLKYPQVISNNGYGYEQGRTLSKDMYQLMGGDTVFYYMYMMMGEQL